MQFIVADDHPMYLDAVTAALRRSFTDAVILSATSVDDVVALADKAAGCDLLLLDFSMPGMVGGDGIARIKEALPAALIVVMSGVATLPDVQKALAMGARGFLSKTMTPAHFAGAVSLILQGGTYLPTEILQEAQGGAVVLPPVAGTAASPPELDMLTPREMQVLKLLSQGLMNKEIGRDLGLAEMTVKLHVRQILRKINARNRSEAATIAVKLGVA